MRQVNQAKQSQLTNLMILPGWSFAATIFGCRQSGQRSHQLRSRVYRRKDCLQQVQVCCFIRRFWFADFQLKICWKLCETSDLRLFGCRRHSKLLGIFNGFFVVLFHEGRRMFWAIFEDDSNGQRFKECWWDDWQAHSDLQQNTSSSYHQRIDRNYLGCLRIGVINSQIVLERFQVWEWSQLKHFC